MAEEIDKYEDDIEKLIDTGKEKGYLTYGEVNDLLPGDITTPDDLDDLLTTINTQGIDVLSGDKFAGVSWTPGLGNAPVLADSVANFQCRAANRYYGGDHIIFLGAVEAYAYTRQEPLLFARGGFGRFVADESKS